MSATNSTKFLPQTYARIGGVIYLIIIIAGLFAEIFVRSKLVVSGDPAATATNILSSQLLWRVGICADLIMQVCDIPLMMIFYVLLRPINKNLALLNLLFNVVQTAVLATNKLNLLMPLFLAGDADYLKAIDPQQLQALGYLFIRLHDHGLGVGLIFFGFVCLIEGYLIFKSGYFPKTLGVLMQIAGACYLINSFAVFLSPQLAGILFPFILLPCLIAELLLALWMIIKGVNISEWEKKVS